MATIDFLIIFVYLICSIAIGLWFSKSQNTDVKSYFLGGNNNTWLLAGLSMVATTFAADTPLAVSEIIQKDGISGNWIWWNMLISGMLTTFFFARYWKRVEVTTDLELISVRYSGAEATFLRVFRAFYLGLVMNAIIIGWVNLAMMKIMIIFFDLDSQTVLYYMFGLMLFTSVYTSFAGLKGVMVTDAFQFIVAMIGCIVMAIIVLQNHHVQGISGIIAKVPAEKLSFFPSQENLPLSTIAGYLLLNWWAMWYPGAEPGGGGYVAQRMMSTKSEKDAVFATLFFQVAHYALRPWTWILVGLSALILYPEPENHAVSFVLIMKNYLPAGLKGLLFVAFLSAYMSTLSTQLNWGVSYIINDGFKIFSNYNDDKLLKISKYLTFSMMLLALFVSTQLESVKQAWEFLLQCGAGIGFVLILRWYWWRISAWSELAATFAPAILLVLSYLIPIAEMLRKPENMYLLVLFSVAITIIVTFLSPTTDSQVLENFVKRVKPKGFWGKHNHLSDKHQDWQYLVLGWFSGVILVYSSLFGIGYLILGNTSNFLYSLLIAVICAFLVKISVQKTFTD